MQLISSPKRLGRSQANGMGGEFAVPTTLTYRKLEAAKLHRPEYFATFLQSLTNVAQGVTDAGEVVERDYIIQHLHIHGWATR